LLRTEDAATEFPIEEDYWVAGAEFADSAGADIINSSLGYTTFQDVAYNHSYSDMDGNTTRAAIGADIAASKGILVVNSAGNSGTSAWKYIGTPADGDSVLAIGAVDSVGMIASFSSIGPSSDGDVKPNVCAQGQQAVIINSGGSVVSGNGTSFSSPIMAGMVACLWQAHSDSSNMAVYRAIEQSAHLFNNPNDQYGFGIPNFAKAHLILSDVNPSNINKDQLFPVFPNPFSESVQGTFYSATAQDIEIRLVSELGQILQSIKGVSAKKRAVPFRFSGLSTLNTGIYFLQVIGECEKYENKVVKMREE
ncbi:MAG: S8 family peptidase, partial [Flavobacteriales bacterium]|nr:S8 family peptidase [Flavobacteriales bacterium]